MSFAVHPLNLGEIELDHSFTVWQTNIGQRIWSPTTAWLILGTKKPILLDTSFQSVDDAKSYEYLNCRRNSNQSFEAQLAKHDLSPADIGHIIHSHVHMDHAGQNHLFSNAKIYVQRRELQNAAAPNMYPSRFYDRLDVARLVHELWNRVEVLDGDVEAILCVMTPGHTPGHQTVYVDTPSRTNHHRWRRCHECTLQHPPAHPTRSPRQHGGNNGWSSATRA
jgi:N-acyl homoserine lactone hydrolase